MWAYAALDQFSVTAHTMMLSKRSKAMGLPLPGEIGSTEFANSVEQLIGFMGTHHLAIISFLANLMNHRAKNKNKDDKPKREKD